MSAAFISIHRAVEHRPRRRLDQRATRFIDPGTLITQWPADVLDRIRPEVGKS